MEQGIRDLNLKDLIRQISNELILSQTERENEQIEPIFQVDRLHIEVNFIVEKNAKIKGGFDLKVVTTGMEEDKKEQLIHKIALDLTPVKNAKSGILPRLSE